MAECPCIQTEETVSNPTVTSMVSYDGAALCFGFSSGNVNDLAEAIATVLCALSNSVTNINIQLASLTIGGNSVILEDIVAPNCLGINDSSTPPQTLTDALNAIINRLCGLYTTDVTTIGLTVPNCAGVTNGEDLTDAINEILTLLCTLNGIAVTWNDHHHKPIPAPYANPLIPYALAVISATDVSGGGTAKVRIPATDYYVDDRNVSKIQEDIALADTADNYVYLDNSTNTWAYAVDDVAIGGAAPNPSGEKVLMVRTGVGTITSITVLIPYYPIDNTLLANSCVKARNLNADVVSTTGAINRDATTGKLSVNVDGIGITIGTLPAELNKLIIKDDGVTKDKVNSNVAGDGLVQNVSGALDVNVRYSIETDTDFIQLTNDANAPGAFRYYGTDSAGAKGYNSIETIIAIPVEITISAAEMALIKTTPKVLYANADSSKVAHLLGLIGFNSFQSQPYTTGSVSDVLEVQYDTAGVKICELSNAFITSVADLVEEIKHNTSNYTRLAGKDLIITMANNPTYYGGYIYGDGIIKCYALIRLVTL